MGALKGQRAQTAIEIAVFGAILVFALGAIIRAGVGRGTQQDSILRATRKALTLSYDTSRDMDNSSRNSASVLVIEDRLTAGSSKYGPIDRVPMLMSGSGTHSSNIFMPVDFGDVKDLPLFDVFVNGQHFSFTTAAFKTINLFSNFGPVSSTTPCPENQCLAYIWIDEAPIETDTTTAVLSVPPGIRYRKACTPCPEIAPNCIGQTTMEPCADSSACDYGTCSDCSSFSDESYEGPGFSTAPCTVLYSIIDNHPKMEKWCNGGSISCEPACSTSADPGCNLSPFERFDLDRNNLDNVPGDNFVPMSQWARFAWQWYLVMGYNELAVLPPISNLSGYLESITVNTLLMGEGINLDEGKNVNIDVDQDLKMESVKATYSIGNLMTGFDVRDSQDGDVDFTFNDRDQGLAPGFTKDVNVYTKVKGTGTYLRIEEGKLFSADGKQYIRTASKKDVVDVIERVFKLSNDTGRLCYNGVPQHPIGYDGKPRNASLKACGNCFSSGNITRTCMDSDPESLTYLLLFIRSRISDYHGHKWVTDVSDDPYVDFKDTKIK